MATEILTVSDQFSHSARRKAVCTFLRSFAGSGDTHFLFSHSPSTDGKTVWLGECAPSDESFETLTLGHGIHEMMHVAHTDFSAAQGIHHLTQRLLNVVEDVRIDKLGEEKSPAYRIWREHLAEYREADGTLRAVSSPALTQSPIESVVTWLHTELMAHAGYRWALRNLSHTRDLVKPMPSSIKRVLVKEALKVNKANSTNDCLKIATKLFKILTDLNDDQQKKLSFVQELDSGMTASLFSENDIGSTPLGDPMQFIEKLLSSPENNNASGSKMRRQSGLGAAADFCGSGICTTPPEPKYRLNRWPLDAAELKNGTLHREFIRQYEKARKSLGSLVQQFSKLLMTKDYFAGYGLAWSGADLRDDWIDAIACSDSRLFEVAATGRSISSEICVLLDRSGSMGVSTMTVAKVAVNALVRAIDRIKGATSRVALFPGLCNDHVALVKETSEPLNSLESKLPSIDAYGSTPIQEAMCWGLDSFKNSRARDKLLLVITDGRFNAQYSQRMEEKLKSAGVEFALMSIGINNSDAAKNHVLVHKTDEINQGLLQLISRTAFVKALRR